MFNSKKKPMVQAEIYKIVKCNGSAQTYVMYNKHVGILKGCKGKIGQYVSVPEDIFD